MPVGRRQLRCGRHIADHHARGQRPGRVAQTALHGGGHQQHVRVDVQLVDGQLGRAVRHADVVTVRQPAVDRVRVRSAAHVRNVAGAEALGQPERGLKCAAAFDQVVLLLEPRRVRDVL